MGLKIVNCGPSYGSRLSVLEIAEYTFNFAFMKAHLPNGVFHMVPVVNDKYFRRWTMSTYTLELFIDEDGAYYTVYNFGTVVARERLLRNES